MLKWSSYVPQSYKVIVVSSMVYRAIRVCSTFELMTNEFETIRELAYKNGDPRNFVEAHTRKTLNRYY